MERLQAASHSIDQQDYEQALVEFAKIIFYDKNSKRQQLLMNNQLQSPRPMPRELRSTSSFATSHQPLPTLKKPYL